MSKNDTSYLAKVYKIYDNTNGNVYFGSTKQPLSKRLQQHKISFKSHLKDKSKKKCTSFEILKNDNYTISLVEEFSCQNKEQLRARERHYIENNECVNKCIPLRTAREYYQANKEQIAEKRKQHYQANKEQIAEQRKQHYQANKEQIAEYKKGYYIDNRERIAEYNKNYYQANKEQIAEYDKNYYQANKERIAEQKKTKRHMNAVKDL